VTSATRSTSLPEVPTIAESGLPNFAATSWFTIDVASGTPSPIVRKLNEDIGKIIASPELAPRWQELGLTILGGSTDTASDFLKKETRIWSDLIRVAKIG
jgi:tripartite-type tricarboxylate transporter receptor subunit TctC